MTTSSPAGLHPAGMPREPVPQQVPGYVAWHRRGMIAAIFLSLTAMMTEVGQLAPVPLYGAMIEALHLDAASVTWTLLATVIVGSATVAAIARAGDIWGPRRVLLVTLTIVTLGYAVSALADGLGVLIAGRAMTGLNASSVLAIAVIQNRMDLRDQKKAVGVLSGALAVAVFTGFALGGLMVELGASWRAALWVAGGLSAITVVGVALCVPESIQVRRTKRTLDLPGIALLGASLTAIAVGLNQAGTWGWSSTATLGTILGGTVGIAAWFGWEYRTPDPLVDPRLVLGRRLGPVYFIWLIVGFTAYFLYQLLLGYAETPKSAAGYGFGLNGLEGALLLLPVMVFGLLIAPVNNRLLLRGVRPKTVMLTGAVEYAVAFGLLRLFHTEIWTIEIAIALYGVAVTTLVGSSLSILAAEAPDDRAAGTSSIYLVMGSTGSSLGTAVYSAIISGHLVEGSSLPSVATFDYGYTVVFLVSVLGVLTTLLVPKDSRAVAGAHG
ncbi:MFS transporter [Streptomyces sp. NPDC002346]